MARRQEVYTARRRAADEEIRTPGKDMLPKKILVREDEKAGGKAAQKPTAKAAKTGVKAASSAKKTEAPPQRPAVRPAKQSGAASGRAQKRALKEKRKKDAIFRDRRRAVSRGADFGVTMIALLTAMFETLGLLLAALRM